MSHAIFVFVCPNCIKGFSHLCMLTSHGISFIIIIKTLFSSIQYAYPKFIMASCRYFSVLTDEIWTGLYLRWSSIWGRFHSITSCHAIPLPLGTFDLVSHWLGTSTGVPEVRMLLLLEACAVKIPRIVGFFLFLTLHRWHEASSSAGCEYHDSRRECFSYFTCYNYDISLIFWHSKEPWHNDILSRHKPW